MSGLERDFKGVWIPREIWLAEDIGWSAKLLLVEVDSLSQNGECFASNDYLGQFFGIGKDRVSKLITELRKKGYVEVNLLYKQGSRQIEKRIITTRGYRQKCLQGIGENTETPIGENTYTPIGENAEDINTEVINTEVINSEENTPPKERKKKHGEYGHVLLKPSEVAKLQEEYGLDMTTKVIKHLDEYIEMKGYKAKSHYLAIRKWVVDAVKEKEQRQSRSKYGKRTEPIPEWMEKEQADKELEEMKRVNAYMRKKTAGNDPDIAARAAALKEQLTGG